MRVSTYDYLRSVLREDAPSPSQAALLIEILQKSSPHTGSPRDRLLTKPVVAELFQVNERTIELWVNAGKLRAVHHGRRCVRFLESDVMAALTREEPRTRSSSSGVGKASEEPAEGDFVIPAERRTA